MRSKEIRATFLDYFRSQGHEIVPSSPLIPANDPTLLFTNAGMVQFKDVFLGLDKRSYVRAATAQRCVRAGGKHNDLENVGYTARHHTFFEMLGNFSFGDYFKEQAIIYAWEFLTKELHIPKEKLWVTVYEKDDEAAEIWLKKIGVNPQHFSRCGEEDNFWAMGDTGPCGPCTEIFYDHGSSVAGAPPGGADADGDRYVEIWNLVFMQYNRSADGVLTPLPKPSVDTGMGLERLAAVLQGVHSNYEIDSFKHLIAAIKKIVNVQKDDEGEISLRVIADHIRSCAFLITDGVVPSNEGRGYVLRRIIRRAIRHGNKLGVQESFFYRVVKPLVEEMGEAYPELVKAQPIVERVLLQEEQQFAKTLAQGLKLLEQDIAQLSSNALSGETIFRLYDTYGFPVDLTADIARERGITLDMNGFEREMAKQRRMSQESSRFQVQEMATFDTQRDTLFTGYELLQHDAIVAEIFVEGQRVQSLMANQQGMVVLDRTPFYAEAGGQIGDRGLLRGRDVEFVVNDTRKQGQTYLHCGAVKQGVLRIGDVVDALVDATRRQATRLNHSATHLLFAALRQVLGQHVVQKGSLVEPERLRFDFAHFEPLTVEQLRQIEQLVNNVIRANYPVTTDIMTVEEAGKSGAIALFGEKYGEKVRVLTMGDFSKEFCGGTHVDRTGDIGFFKITTETGIAAGIRRIEAITGEYALEWVRRMEQQLRDIASSVKANLDDASEKVRQLLEQKRQADSTIGQLKSKLARSAIDDIVAQAVDVKGVKVLAAELHDLDLQGMRHLFDQLKSKLPQSVIVLGLAHEGRVNLLASVSAAYTDKVKANELVNKVAVQVGGKGGGKADMAQAGGTQVEKLKSALQFVVPWVKAQL